MTHPYTSGAARQVQSRNSAERKPVFRRIIRHGQAEFPVLFDGETNAAFRSIAPEEKYRRDRARKIMVDADINFAIKAERGGAPPMFQKTGTFVLGLVTRAIIRPAPLRRINCLEIHQASAHHYVRILVEAYMKSLGNKAKYCRYWTVSSGVAVPILGDLEARHREFTERLSKARVWMRRKYGIETLLRTTEFTINHEKGTVNYHANLLVLPHRKLGPAAWSEFLSEAWQRFGAHWQDNGPIKDLSELMKYCLKGNDRDGLDDETCAWLAGSLKGKRLVVPCDGFKEFCAKLRKADVRMCRECDANGNPHYFVRPILRTRRGKNDNRKPDDSPRPHAYLLGVMKPHCRATCYAEPHAVIRGDPEMFREELSAGARRHLEAREARALADWQAAGHPPPEIAMNQAAAIMGARSAQEASTCVIFADPSARDPSRLDTTQTIFTDRDPLTWSVNDNRPRKPPD